MLPTKSNTSGKDCIPTSSDCVIWQGPNIPGINLCNGDSISDVLYKVAQNLTTVQSTFNLSALQLNDLATFCTTIAGPPTGNNKTLLNVLDYIVKKLDCVNDKVDAIPAPTAPQQPNIELPVCLRYVSGGVPVNTLVHSAATLHIANEFCSLKSIVNSHASLIAQNTTNIASLEARVNNLNLTIPSLTPTCVLPAVPQSMVSVVTALEKQYCELKNLLGPNNNLVSATTQQCANLGTSNALSRPGTISSIPGWNATVGNLAQAIQNLWVVVCDMRGVMADIKDCCSKGDCTEFKFDFTAATNAQRTRVTIQFNPLTVIPSDFEDAINGSTIEITDAPNGTSKIIKTIMLKQIMTQQSNPGVYEFDVAGNNVTGGTPLNTSQKYTLKVTGVVTKPGVITCDKTETKTLTPPCPVITSVNAAFV